MLMVQKTKHFLFPIKNAHVLKNNIKEETQ